MGELREWGRPRTYAHRDQIPSYIRIHLEPVETLPELVLVAWAVQGVVLSRHACDRDAVLEPPEGISARHGLSRRPKDHYTMGWAGLEPATWRL